MSFGRWTVRIRKCPIRISKVGVKTELVQFALLRNRVRAFGEITQEKGEEEKQDLPRTLDFGCGFAKELTPQVCIDIQPPFMELSKAFLNNS
ncbi:hypothetical protein H5410_003502 [Solanum commersonii]|uniref:Uncharacterized protein n=1 Tax=Solanum commersonii TaxID=4109 RepID=A0A9J6B527_SOLCO|nr:hypothetical protein H5410_003502 [Solanum commersonii]